MPVQRNTRLELFPSSRQKKLAKKWGPVLQQLSAETGFTLRFATAPDIPTFEKATCIG